MKTYQIVQSYYRERDLSIITGIPRKTLQRYRQTGEGPPWVNFGQRSIRYPIKEFETWVETNTHRLGTPPQES